MSGDRAASVMQTRIGGPGRGDDERDDAREPSGA